MKIASYSHKGIDSYGVVTEDGIIDLGARIGDTYPGMLELLRSEALNAAADAAKGASVDFSFDEVNLLRPIPYPEKIF